MSKLEIVSKRELAIDAFHNHLDACERCRNHPFNLCPKGDKLLNTLAEISPPAIQVERPLPH